MEISPYHTRFSPQGKAQRGQPQGKAHSPQGKAQSGQPQGKAQRGQYLLAVDLDC